MSFPLKNLLRCMADALKEMAPQEQERFRKESIELSCRDLNSTIQQMAVVRAAQKSRSSEPPRDPHRGVAKAGQ